MTASVKKRRAVHVGVNLNNREALIAPEYGARELLELGERAERVGFDSLWVGDSLVARPRYEPLVLLAALAEQRRYIDTYHPGFADAVGLDDWGPSGAADDVARWFQDFSDASVTSFICRFAALDQPGQVERFAGEVLPAVRRQDSVDSPAPAVGTSTSTPQVRAR